MLKLKCLGLVAAIAGAFGYSAAFGVAWDLRPLYSVPAGATFIVRQPILLDANAGTIRFGNGRLLATGEPTTPLSCHLSLWSHSDRDRVLPSGSSFSVGGVPEVDYLPVNGIVRSTVKIPIASKVIRYVVCTGYYPENAVAPYPIFGDLPRSFGAYLTLDLPAAQPVQPDRTR